MHSKESVGISRRSFIKGSSLGLMGAGALCTGVVTMTSCSQEGQGKKRSGVEKATASAKGYGGDVEVTLSVDTSNGSIKEVSIEGSMETPNKGGKAIEKLATAIQEAQSLDVDTVSGATITSTAAMVAATAAYGSAMNGDELGNLKMAPGSYTASYKSGYWRIVDLPVTVTVNEDSILKIEVPEDRFAHGDTEVFLQCAKEKFFPRIIENQSFNVDTVSSATLSCDGVRNAARLALRQAFEENGVDGSAVGKFMQPVDLTCNAPTEELDADVLVVGLGNGGIMSMLSACETIQERNGKKPVSIIGIDKAGKVGGKSALTHEACAINPVQYAKDFNEGNEYIDKEDFRRRWKEFASENGEMLAKEECIDVMVDESGKTIDWLYAHGWRYGTVAKGAGTALAGGLTSFNSVCSSRADPGTYEDRRKVVNQFYSQFIDAVKAQGGEIYLETEGYELIIEGNKIAGVKARNVVTGQEYVIHAKSVIMNTGGYSSNPQMMSTLLDESRAGFYRTVGTGCDTGLMIQSALDNGAGTFNMGMSPILMHCGLDHWLSRYPIVPNTEKLQNRTGRHDVTTLNSIPNGCAYSGTAIAVGRDGKRFMNEYDYESFSQKLEVDSFAHWKGGPHYFVIVSDEVLSDIEKTGFNAISSWDGYNTQGKIAPDQPVPEVYEGLDYAVEEGMAWKADTLEELAGQIEIDPSILKETVDTYNGFVAAGADDEYGKDPKFLLKIGTAPFYALKVFNTTFGTCGGLDVDAQMRVLKDDHTTPIDGLYAIGCDSLGVVHNPNRHYCGFGGIAQMWLQTGGRLAGINAAAYVGDAYGYAEKSVALSEIPAGF